MSSIFRNSCRTEVIMISELNKIIIVQKGEYGRRLVRFLERNLPAATRTILFTNKKMLQETAEVADCYLIDRDFFREEGAISGIPPERIIWLSSEPAAPENADPPSSSDSGFGRAFNRFEPPQKLLDLLAGEDFIGEVTEQRKSRISLIYSPINQENLYGLARNLMQEGDLYLGAEDIGFSGEKEMDMGDLCYYIHLKEEHILETMQQMLREEEGRYCLDSPDMYFFLREVTTDEYRWFFDRLRAASYPEVYIGAGSGFLSDPAMFHLFDRVILIDSQQNERQHFFCDRLEAMLKDDYFSFEGQVVRVGL